jgi:CcmD family protein
VRNFHFLFAAWIAVWAVFFAYELSVASRVSRLRDEIDRLKKQLKES